MKKKAKEKPVVPDYRAPVYKDMRKHAFKFRDMDRRRAVEIMGNATCGD
jgi:hypothetical protein